MISNFDAGVSYDGKRRDDVAVKIIKSSHGNRRRHLLVYVRETERVREERVCDCGGRLEPSRARNRYQLFDGFVLALFAAICEPVFTVAFDADAADRLAVLVKRDAARVSGKPQRQ